VALWSGSAEAVQSHLRVPRDRIVVVPNGVVPDRFPPASQATCEDARRAFGLEPARPTLVVVGALVPEKGVDLVIDATAALPGAQLLVVGDGPERSTLAERADAAAPGRVAFAGSVAEPARAYAAADVVVLASRGGDSMPAVLIEAGLSGVPAIATPIEAIPEVVRDGVTGVLVPVGDTAALVAAASDLLADRDRARAYGTAAREHCLANFSLSVVAEQWHSVLVDAAARS
jgi:glycosyltransferase involved in cell wall biosynthesis